MIVEGEGTTEKNPTSRMATGPVLNVEIITSLGERIAIAAMPLRAMREAAVAHVVIIGVVTEEAVDSVEIIGVVTEEMEDNVETIVVVTEEMEVNVEMTEAEDAQVIVNNDRVMTDHRAENTKVAMIANQSDGTHEDPVDGARKARVETVGAEISRGVFI